MRKLFAALTVLVALSGPSLALPPAGGGDPTAGLEAPVASPAPVGPSSDVRIEITSTDKKKGVGHGVGSGVYLGKGIVVTANHVVDSATKVEVILDRGGVGAERLHTTVIAKSQKADMAILKVDGVPEDTAVARLACRAPVIGEPIEVVGNPLGVGFVHTWGRVAGVLRQEDGAPMNVVPIDASIAPGNSGGPVYDRDGKVLGLADAMLTDGSSSVKIMTSVLSLPMCQEHTPTS